MAHCHGHHEHSGNGHHHHHHHHDDDDGTINQTKYLFTVGGGGGDDHNHQHKNCHETEKHSQLPNGSTTTTTTTATTTTTTNSNNKPMTTVGNMVAKHNSNTSTMIIGKFRTATVLCSIFLIVEVIGGYISSSLAIYSDAAHLVSDLASIGVAMGAAYLADLPQTQYYTYGLKRVESLAALLSMVSLAAISIYLFIAALVRLWIPEPVNGQVMSGVAFIGVLVNITLAAVLGEHHVHMPGAAACSHHHDHHEGHQSSGHSSSQQAQSYSATTTTTNKSSRNCAEHGHDHSHHDHVGSDHNHASPVSSHHGSHDCAGHDHSSQDNQPTKKSDDDEEHGHAEFAHEQTPLLLENHRLTEPPSKKIVSSWEISDYIPFLPDNINLRATYLHVLGDLLQSVAVLIAGLLLWHFPEQTWIDAVTTLLFCVIVFLSTIQTLKSSLAVLLQQVPNSVEYQDLFDRISALPNIYNVHDLHIWSIAHGIPSLSVHCHTNDATPQETMEGIYNICSNAGIFHVTAQVQTCNGGTSCVTCANSICRIESC